MKLTTKHVELVGTLIRDLFWRTQILKKGSCSCKLYWPLDSLLFFLLSTFLNTALSGYFPAYHLKETKSILFMVGKCKLSDYLNFSHITLLCHPFTVCPEESYTGLGFFLPHSLPLKLY